MRWGIKREQQQCILRVKFRSILTAGLTLALFVIEMCKKRVGTTDT